MKSRRTIVLALSAAGAMLLDGCESKPLRPLEVDGTYCFHTGKSRHRTCTDVPVPPASVESEAKRFDATPGAVTLYVVRRRWADAANRVPVWIDQSALVLTVPASVLRARLTPGDHNLAVEWEGKRSVQTITARAGEVVFVELVGADWSWGATYRWATSDAEGARQRAAKSKLIADLDLRS